MPPRSNVTVAVSVRTTVSSSIVALTVSSPEPPPSFREFLSTARDTSGATSSSVSFNSVSLTVRPGAEPPIRMVSSPSSSLSSAGVIVTFVVPEREFFGIVTPPPPVRE